MSVTTSAHNGTSVATKHNVRDESLAERENAKDPHIDLDAESEVLISDSIGVDGITLRDKYHEIFDEAVCAYNETQKRKDRKIQSYYDKIKNAKKENLCYEMILTVGCYKNFNSKFKNEADQISNDDVKKLLTDALEEIQRRFPHLCVVGAYYHADEYHLDADGTKLWSAPHVHLDYVPVAEGYKKGLSLRNGLNKALACDGLKAKGYSQTPQMLLQDACRDILDDLVKKELGLEVTHPIMEEREDKREHMKKAEYALSKELAESKARNAELDAKWLTVHNSYNQLEESVSKLRSESKSLKSSNKTLKKANAELQKNLQRVKDLEKSNAEKDKELLGLKRQISDAERNEAKYRDLYQSARKDAETAKSKLKDSYEDVSRLSWIVMRLRIQLTKFFQTVHDLISKKRLDDMTDYAVDKYTDEVYTSDAFSDEQIEKMTKEAFVATKEKYAHKIRQRDWHDDYER